MGICTPKTGFVAGYAGAALYSFLLLFVLSIVGCGGSTENPSERNEQITKVTDVDGSSTTVQTLPSSVSADETGSQSETATVAEEFPGIPSVQEPTAESLKAVMTAWLKARYAHDPATRVAAVEAMLLQPEDIPIMFPKLGKQERELATRLVVAMRLWASSFAWHHDMDALQRFRKEQEAQNKLSGPVNLRELVENDDIQVFLKRVPGEIPVFLMDVRHFRFASDRFFFVNQRWIWTDEFEEGIELFSAGTLAEEMVGNFEREVQTRLKRYPLPVEEPIASSGTVQKPASSPPGTRASGAARADSAREPLNTEAIEVDTSRAGEDSDSSQIKKLQGKWQLFSMQLSASKPPLGGRHVKGWTAMIRGDQFTLETGQSDPVKRTIQLGKTAGMKTIDLEESPGRIYPGIYRFKTETYLVGEKKIARTILTICFAEEGDKRPREFAVREESHRLWKFYLITDDE